MKCETKGCNNERGRTLICEPCRYIKRKKKDPIKWAYETLKRNSKRRGIVFTITLEHFQEFCYATKLLENRGREKDHYSIDRINNDLGYEPGNLQVMTVSLNAQKKKKVYNPETKSSVYMRVGMNSMSMVEDDDLPF